MKTLVMAESAGFCFGVRRSVEMAERLLESGAKAASLGELIHNAQVVQEMASRGLRVISSADEASPDETVMIRAHGVAPAVLRALEERGITVVDATCPKVRAIHEIVRRASGEGRFVIIVGMRRHPEVEGICGRCGEHKVIENAREMEEWLSENPSIWNKPITVVVQTTQTQKYLIQYALLRLRGRTRRQRFPAVATLWS